MINEAMAKKAIILARVSTEEQAKDTHFSIPAQFRNLREYVAKGGKFGSIKEKVDEYELEESAFKGNRPRFTKIIEKMKSFDEPIALVFDNIDRFSRQTKSESLIEIEKLRLKGMVELHSVTTGLVIHRNSPANDLMVWNILLAVAEGRSREISEKVKASIREKLAQGIFPGGMTPNGYENVRKEIVPGKIIKEIQIDDERAKFVKRCWRLFATGKYSEESLAKMLRKQGFYTKTKKVSVNGKLVNTEPKLVTKSDIAALLKNPFYTGKFYYRNPDTGERELWPKEGLAKNYEPLISWELYEQVQKILEKNNSRSAGYKKNDFILRGLVTCGYCGCFMTPEEFRRTYKNPSSPGANRVHYRCTNGRKYKDPDWYKKKFGTDYDAVFVATKGKNKGQKVYPCPQRSWEEKEIEEAILTELEIINYGEDVFDLLRAVLERDYEERTEFTEDQIRASKAEYTKNEDLIKVMVRNIAIEQNLDLREEFRKQYQELKSRQAELKEEIELLEQAIEVDTDEIVETLVMCCNLGKQYKKLDEERKRDLVSFCFSEIKVQRGQVGFKKCKTKLRNAQGVHLVWNEPFKTLLEINFDEFIRELDRNQGKEGILTKEKVMEASLLP
ncbi:MAG: recombinase family protein [Promethearchaeota archaeon]